MILCSIFQGKHIPTIQENEIKNKISDNLIEINKLIKNRNTTIKLEELGNIKENLYLISELLKTKIENKNQSTSTKIYYIKLKSRNKEYYKIGITKYNILTRFRKENPFQVKIDKVIFEINYDNAEILEEKILSLNKSYKLNPNYKNIKNKILESGNTEIFKHDILKLDSNLQ